MLSREMLQRKARVLSLVVAAVGGFPLGRRVAMIMIWHACEHAGNTRLSLTPTHTTPFRTLLVLAEQYDASQTIKRKCRVPCLLQSVHLHMRGHHGWWLTFEDFFFLSSRQRLPPQEGRQRLPILSKVTFW
jgi:hypothetical protein